MSEVITAPSRYSSEQNRAASAPARTRAHSRGHSKTVEAGPDRSYLRDWPRRSGRHRDHVRHRLGGVVGARLAPQIILSSGPQAWLRTDSPWPLRTIWRRARKTKSFITPRPSNAGTSRGVPGRGSTRSRSFAHLASGHPDGAVASITAERDCWVRMMIREEYSSPSHTLAAARRPCHLLSRLRSGASGSLLSQAGGILLGSPARLPG